MRKRFPVHVNRKTSLVIAGFGNEVRFFALTTSVFVVLYCMTSIQYSQAQDKFKNTVEFLQNHFNIDKKPALEFRNTGKAAGIFYPMDNKVVINPLFFRKNAEDMIANTIPHEVAHAFAHYHFRLALRRQIKSHGSEWASIMRLMKLKPTVCHNYDTDGIGRSVARYVNKCQCGIEIKITANLLGKMLKGNGYRCRTCKTPLPRSGWMVKQKVKPVIINQETPPDEEIKPLDISMEDLGNLDF